MRIEESQTGVYDYGCIMINVDFPELTQVQSQIKTGDIYFGDNVEIFGLEDEPHVSLLHGVLPGLTLNDVLPQIEKISIEKVIINGLSSFNNDGYDVLKFNTEGDLFFMYNILLKNSIPNKNEYPTYSPHLTIAYLLPGLGDIYSQKIDFGRKELHVNHISFSTPEGKKYKIYK